MKRKVFAFAVVGLLSLTVTSCQTETKLDPNDGKELIATSLNKSKQDVIEALNGDFVGADIKMDSTLGFKANYVDDISASTQPDIKINDIDLSATFDFDFQSNYDLANLRATTPSLTNCELYNHIITTQKINDIENTQISKTYQNGNTIYWHQQLNEEVNKDSKTLDETNIGEFVTDAIKVIDSVDDFFKGVVPEGFTSNEIFKKLYEFVFKINGLVKSYRNKEITSQDIVNEFYKATGIHNEMIPQQVNELFIVIVENFIKYDLSTYFYYTQLKDKNNNIELSGSINYEAWLNVIKTEFENDKKNLDKESFYYDMLVSYCDMFVSLLPTDINYDLTANINSSGQLTSFAYETSFEGLISKDITSLFSPMTESKPIEYKATSSGSFSFNISKDKVEIKNTIVL